MSAAPAFSLDHARYDQTTWVGRAKHFFAITNPAFLFTTDATLKDALDKLQRFKEKRSLPGTTDEELWKARTMRDAVLHPDTKQPIPAAFRVCAFVPANIPICAGMLMTAPTTFNVLFWQWINQSYNAGFNYCNRNASSQLTDADIATAYVAATSASCGIAYALGEFAKKSTSLSPATAAMVQKTVPYFACVAANIFNLGAMRIGEVREGVPVKDADGNVLGTSLRAGRYALAQTGFTRTILPAPVLLVPPIIMRYLDTKRVIPPRFRPAVELGVIVSCVWGALPCAIALFPQEASLPVTSLEPHFHGLRNARGEPITNVFFNKGI